MEEKAADEMEVAKKANEEREKIKKAAQGRIKKFNHKLYKQFILSFSLRLNCEAIPLKFPEETIFAQAFCLQKGCGG
jgi:hypothetical protein